MQKENQFTLTQANKVVGSEGVEITIVDRNQIWYRVADKHVVITREIYIADDGAPDGSYVYLNYPLFWSDGRKVTCEELGIIKNDLEKATDLMDTKFRIQE